MLPVSTEIQSGLSHNNVTVQVWTDGVFQASSYTLSSLLEIAESSDFGVLVLGPDDTAIRRGQTVNVPRDNVVFELGLFVGSVGRDRTFIVKPRGSNLTLPTDILGVTPLEYDSDPAVPMSIRIAPVCTQIRSLIAALGVRQGR
jgi:predicted nucleotide-binding protein